MKLLLSKIKLVHIVTPLMAFLIPIKPLIILVGVMISLDTITGVWKSKKKKVPITSRALSAVVSKMVLYQAAVILFFALEKYMLGDFIGLFTSIPLFLTKVVSTILCGIEITSINENFKSATNKSLWERIKEVLKRAQTAKNELNDFDDLFPKK